jgi:hypothetical protein
LTPALDYAVASVMVHRKSVPGQGSLFDAEAPAPPARRDRSAADGPWRMPPTEGSTVAAIRVRWARRLTPVQVTRVEVTLARVARQLSQLGFGAVVVERSFVRRRRR